MARVYFFTLILLVAGLFSHGVNSGTAWAEVVNQGRCYDAAGFEIACADTGQDGEIQAGTAWPDPRFMDNGDGTMTDALTGLIWLKDAGCLADATQGGALDKIGDFNVHPDVYDCAGYQADYGDWRLPAVREIESLTNLTASNQASWLSEAGFVSVRAAGYWSATPAASAYHGWLVELGAGAVDYAPKTASNAIWPVRGAALSETQKEKNTPAEPPGRRFVVNDDSTVTDRETGLIWLRQAGGHGGLTWSEALALGASLDAGPGKGGADAGWRLPNRRELQSLLDYRQDYPALPPDAPFTEVRASYYWTSSTAAASPDQAWAVHPLYGETKPVRKEEKAAAWPVRRVAAAANRLAQTADWLQEKKTPAADVRLPKEAIGTSVPRFTTNPDGTVTDNLTGLMWLADGDCLGKMSWPEAQEAVALLNSEENPYTCDGYTGSYQDWLLPGTEHLQELRPPGETDPVAWLNERGFSNVHPQGYWTKNDTLTNIYYAWLFNLRAGEKRKYPKEFKFYALPCRLTK